MWARFYLSGMPAMSRLHMCVDLSVDLSGRLTEIGFIAGCTFFTGVLGRTKYPVAPESDMASFLAICIIDIDYAFFICSLVRLLIIIVLSSLSSVGASSTNILVVFCVVGYNELTVFGSLFVLSILSDHGPVAPTRQPLRFCCCCCCCFQISCWSITQFAFPSCCARIHPLPAP